VLAHRRPRDPHNPRKELAAVQIIDTDRPSVELIRSADQEMTLLVWPKRPTPVPRKLSETVATTCRILAANAAVELASRRGRKRW
jgi:hypothetical protein